MFISINENNILTGVADSNYDNQFPIETDDYEITAPLNCYKYEDNEIVFEPTQEYIQQQESLTKKQNQNNYYDNLFDNHSSLDNVLTDQYDLGGSFASYIESLENTIDDILNSGGTMSNETDWEGTCHWYAKRIKLGRCIMDKVPEQLRERVQEIIDEENKNV